MQPLFGHFVVIIQHHFVVTFPASKKVAYFRNVATEIVVAYTQRSFLATFLEKVLARRISTMTEGRGYYAIACTPQGGVFMDGVVFRLGENRFWYVQADGPFETWLMAHTGAFDVTISDPRSRVLQIQGPASLEIMKAASGGAIDESMKYFRSGYFDIGGQRLYVSRTGFTNELGFEIYSEEATTDHLALWDHLMDCGAPHGMEFSSTRALTIRRIEGGILGNGTDMTPDMTPYEAGLAPFINMDKGDFIGRTALLDADRSCRTWGMRTAGGVAQLGDTITIDGQTVGSVRGTAWSPYLQCGVSIVRMRSAQHGPSTEVSVETADGGTATAVLCTLPMYDAERLIPRGKLVDIPESR